MKKILIAVLAVAVLFGFAACNDGSSSTASGVIRGATVTGGEKVYIPGEEVDLSDYEFSLTMEDGSTQPANGSDFVFDSLVVPSYSATATNNETIKGTYKGMDYVKVTLPVKVGKVTKLEISGDATVGEYYVPSSSASAEYKDNLIKLDGLTIKATYEYEGSTGTADVSIDNKNLSAKLSDWTSAGEKTVTVAFDALAEATYKVDLKANLVKSIDLKQTDGYTVYVGNGAADLVYTTDPKATEGVYVEATYQNGETKVLASSDATITFGTSDSAITTAFANLADLTPETAAATTLYVKCAGLAAVEDFTQTDSLELNVVANAPEKLSVAAGTSLTLNALKAEDFTDPSKDATFKGLFEVKVVYANGEKADEALAPNEFTIVSPTAAERDFSKLTAGQRIKVSVTATADDGKELKGEAEIKIEAAP